VNKTLNLKKIRQCPLLSYPNPSTFLEESQKTISRMHITSLWENEYG